MRAFVKDGVVIGLYSTESNVPSGCLEISLAGRTDIPAIGWKYDEESDVFSKPALVKVDTTLEELQKAAINIVNRAACEVRDSYIGLLPNQLAIYTAKFQDAKAYKLGVLGKDSSSYPWLSAEMSATGDSVDTCVERFLTKYSALITALSSSEEIRIYALSLIRNSTSVEDIREAKTHALNELKLLVA